MDNLVFESVETISKLIRTKQISAVETLTLFLEQIDRVNPTLNAVVQLVPNRALKEARQADEMIVRGEIQGPLHGVPMTIKDSFDTSGIVSTWGTPGRAQYIPAQDATAVSRLRSAGAILMGKTNTPEFTLSFETTNKVYGQTNNPYNPERSSGGSSGGAAAIVAAGGSPFDVGTDTGGSIRLPSHFCGVAGIKPTSGRVPRTGHAIGPGGLLDGLTHVGPIARYVEDLALLLPILSGPDGCDPFIVPVPLGDPRAVGLRGLRGAFHTDNGLQKPIPEIVSAVEESVKSLNNAGIVFEDKNPPNTEETLELFGRLFSWDGYAWVRRLLDQAGTTLEQTGLRNASNVDLSMAPVSTASELIEDWDRFRKEMLTFLDTYDVLIAPVNGRQALRHGTFGQEDANFGYTMTYNLTGWPSAVVRVGTADDGLPIGVQIIGKPWREDVVLAVAQHLQDELGGWQPPKFV